MSTELQTMYGWARQTRDLMFRYCESLPPPVYRRELADNGHGSLRNLHLHVAESYCYWLEPPLTGAPAQTFPRDRYPDVAAVRQAFAAVDDLVARFLDRFTGTLDTPLQITVFGALPLTLTPLWLFSRTLTHEFHHHGQMVALGRRMGYPAPYLDLVVP